MPKVALRPIDSFSDMLKSNMRLVKGNKSEKELAKVINTAQGTVNNRLKNPLDMRLHELFNLCEKTHVDIGDFVSKKLKIG